MFTTSFTFSFEERDCTCNCAKISTSTSVAMTSIVDSRAHLLKRCGDIGMSDRAKAQLIQNNLDTMGKLAFSIGQPGQPLDNAEFDNYARNTLGAMMSQADAAVLKRLVFEGHTLVLGQLRELVADPNAAASRKLPNVEREHRMADLKRRLTGVVVERQLEPSHELLEAMTQQKESNQLTYVQLERCSSREWEITMGKSKRQLSLDAEKLLIKERSDIPDQYHSSELQAFEALRRRGIAMAFADVMSWECHERYLQQLTSHLRLDPPQNYNRPTLQQVLKADRQVFMYLIRVGAQLKRLPDNTLDLDSKIFEALQSYEVGFHLLPLPKTGQRPEGQAAPSTSGQPSNVKGGNWQGPRFQPYKGKGHQAGGKGKSKGGKGLLPKFLLGRDNTNMDMHGRRLCFNFQTGKCSDAPDGGECARGWHLCCREGCHAPHAEKDHDKRK